MQIKELQEWVRADWDNHSLVQPNPHVQLLYLFEELGEMAEAIRKKVGHKEHKNEATDLEGEMGDVLIALFTVANNHHIDLEEAVQKTMSKIKTRHAEGY
jgi:NTP pyrophosphatase (non-canonical NTP hydrolase)